MELFRLFGSLAINGADQAEQEINDVTNTAEKSESRISSAFKKIGAAVAAAFAIDKIKDFGVAIVQASAEVAAEEAAFSQIMGTYSDQAAEKVAKIADATGMVDSRLTPYMTSMTAKFKGLGFDIDGATDLASTGLTIAADAAAFWDKSLDDSMGSLNSFVNGNYEGGEAIGLFANETTLAKWAADNLGYTWADLSEKEKQFTRLQFAKAMQEASGAAGQASKESGAYQNVMGNLTEAWRQFKAQVGEPVLQNIVIPAMKWLGDFITNTLQPGFENLKAKVGELTAFYKEHKGVIDAVAIAVGILSGAVMTYNTYMTLQPAILKAASTAQKVWSTAVALATGKIKLATIAQKAFNLVMSLNPVGLVVAAIAALVAIFVVAYNKSETFRAAVDKLFGKLKELWGVIAEQLEPVFNEFMGILDELWNLAQATIIPMFKDIVNAAIELWNTIKPVIDALLPLFKKVFSAILTIVSTDLKNVLEVVRVVLNTIKNVIAFITAIIKGDWEGAWTAIKNIFFGIWEGIKNIASNNINALKNMFGGAWEAIKNTTINAWNGIKNWLSGVWSGIKNTASNTWNGIKNTAINTWDSIKNAITTPINNARNAVKSAIDRIKGLFNFKWSLPALKVPKFGISPSGWKVGDLLKGKIPKLSVKWMADGGIFDEPTLFNTHNGAYGVGEAGAEAVTPIDKLTGYVQTAVKNETNGLSDRLDRLIDLLVRFFPELLNGMDKSVVLDSGALVGQLAPKMNKKFNDMAKANARGG